MRFCLWSFLLACLVLLASPFQGAAHAAMVDCHGQAVAEQPAHTSMRAEVAQSLAFQQMAADAHHISKADKCNLCSPCCAGALVNTVQLPSMAVALGAAAFPDPTSANPAPLLAGLDRPPRHLAA